MAKDQTKRVSREELDKDQAAFNALQNVVGYAPSNPAHGLTSLQTAFNEMRAAQAAEDQATAAMAAARDVAVHKEWAAHNLMLGVKDQIKAQFGKDSNEVQALGLKKASEYKPKSGRPKTRSAP
jgi:hypothetical protein